MEQPNLMRACARKKINHAHWTSGLQTRLVGKDAFLEASVENCTRAPLVLEYVRVDPASGLTAQQISSNMPRKDQHSTQFEEWMEGLEASAVFTKTSNRIWCYAKGC